MSRSSDKRRLFLGISPSFEILEDLVGLQHQLRGSLGLGGKQQVRWLAPEALHLTLHFLGEWSAEEQEHLEENLTGVPADITGGFQELTEITGFPRPAAARVLVLAASAPAPPLARLHQWLGEGLLRWGHPPEIRPFRPHITLARFREPFRLEPARRGREPVKLEYSRYCLFESRLAPEGARYRILKEFPLATAPSS